MSKKQMSKASNKQMSKASNKQQALDTVPDYINTGTGRGNEQVSASDLVIPRIDLIQDLSPQRKKTAPEYIEGAEEGMMFNSLTRELYGDEVVVVPVLFKKEYLVWKDRNQGGGFRGAYPTLDAANDFIISQEDKKSLQAIDTAQHFVLLCHDDGRVEECVISMSRTKMKVSRQWNSLIRLAGGDRFSRAYLLSAVQDGNDKGEFFNFSVKQIGFPPEPVYRKAEKLYTDIVGGHVSVVPDRGYDEEVMDGETVEEF